MPILLHIVYNIRSLPACRQWEMVVVTGEGTDGFTSTCHQRTELVMLSHIEIISLTASLLFALLKVPSR